MNRVLKKTKYLALTYQYVNITAKELAEDILKQTRSKASIELNPIEKIIIAIEKYSDNLNQHAHVFIELEKVVYIRNIVYWSDIFSISGSINPHINLCMNEKAYINYICKETISDKYFSDSNYKKETKDLYEELRILSNKKKDSTTLNLNEITDKYSLEAQREKKNRGVINYLRQSLVNKRENKKAVSYKEYEKDENNTKRLFKDYGYNAFLNFFRDLIVDSILDTEKYKRTGVIEYRRSKESIWIKGPQDIGKTRMMEAVHIEVAYMLRSMHVRCVSITCNNVEDLQCINSLSRDTIALTLLDDFEFIERDGKEMSSKKILNLLHGNADAKTIPSRYDNIRIPQTVNKVFLTNYNLAEISKHLSKEHFSRVKQYELEDVIYKYNDDLTVTLSISYKEHRYEGIKKFNYKTSIISIDKTI